MFKKSVAHMQKKINFINSILTNIIESYRKKLEQCFSKTDYKNKQMKTDIRQ